MDKLADTFGLTIASTQALFGGCLRLIKWGLVETLGLAPKGHHGALALTDGLPMPPPLPKYSSKSATLVAQPLSGLGFQPRAELGR
jgi:hypothetical protein